MTNDDGEAPSSETGDPVTGDTWDRLWEILESDDAGSTVYVYRVDREGRSQKPYLLRCPAYPYVPERLRDEYGGGDFLFLIRRGRTMSFRGMVSIEPLPKNAGVGSR